MGRTYKVGEGVAVLFAADDVGELLGIGHWRDMLGAGEGFDYRRRLFQSIMETLRVSRYLYSGPIGTACQPKVSSLPLTDGRARAKCRIE